MNTVEAESLLANRLTEYRRLPYGQLASRVDQQDEFEVRGKSGTEYQIAIQFFWDSRPQENIRVFGAVDEGWTASSPLCDGFIMAPDGSFIGEESV